VEFEEGDVPHAEAALKRLAKKGFAQCVEDQGALTLRNPSRPAKGGRVGGGADILQVRFLVRAPGRAEGVDVAKVQGRGMSPALVRCIVGVHCT
jgi:hypothetical protein